MTGMAGTHRRVRRTTAAMVAAGVLLVACTDGGDDGTDPVQQDEPDEETAIAEPDPEQPDDAEDNGSSDQAEAAEEGVDGEGSDGADDEPTSTGGTPVGPDPAALADPIASYTHEVPDSSGGTLRVDITAMEIVGELLRVEVTFVPDLPVDPGVTINEVVRDSSGAQQVSPLLIDPHNLLEYRQVTNAMPNGTSFGMADGVPRTFAFYFGKPVQDAPSFDLVLAPEFPTLTDVPYTP